MQYPACGTFGRYHLVREASQTGKSPTSNIETTELSQYQVSPFPSALHSSVIRGHGPGDPATRSLAGHHGSPLNCPKG